jgi:hypothetical protein
MDADAEEFGHEHAADRKIVWVPRVKRNQPFLRWQRYSQSKLAYREAATPVCADAFRASMIAFIFATLLAPFLRSVAAPCPSTGG